MTPPPPPSDTVHLNALTDEALASGLPRRQKVVLVMDLVESVRLMAANEAAVVQRWHAFVQHARAQVLPARHGRHVKSLGDGLLAEFDSAPEAVQAAHELHHYFDDSNRSLPPDQQFHLRASLAQPRGQPFAACALGGGRGGCGVWCWAVPAHDEHAVAGADLALHALPKRLGLKLRSVRSRAVDLMRRHTRRQQGAGSARAGSPCSGIRS